MKFFYHKKSYKERKRGVFFLLAALSLLLPQYAGAKEYTLSMLPLYSTEEIHKRITPFAEYLSRKTGLTIKPVLTADFSQYIEKAKSGVISIGYQNPYVYVKIAEKHEAVAMALSGYSGNEFRGIIITKRHSPLYTLSDLKGKRISIVGKTSAGGFLSQNYTLLKNDIDVFKDCIVEEAAENKQENVILSVYAGEVDAGFIRETAFKKAKDFIPERSIKVLTATQWLPNWALSLSRDMPAKDREKIVAAIRDLGKGNSALQGLKVSGFAMAKDSSYDVVRKAAGMDAAEKSKEKKE